MQGLVNFATALADGLAVVLPTFCYLAACMCFTYFVWTLWKWSSRTRVIIITASSARGRRLFP